MFSTATQNNYGCGIFEKDTPYGFGLEAIGDFVRVNIGGTYSKASSSVVLPKHRWVHVAAVYDSATSGVRLYFDGSLVASVGASTSPLWGALSATIGQRPDSGFPTLAGAIDEVRFWDTARSTAQIQADMFNSISAQANLVGLWHFDEASGVTASDSSGNGLNGTLSNSPQWVPDAPRNITDLQAVAVSTGLGASSQTVTLSWTAPGDNGDFGQLNGSTYSVRAATFPIDSDAAFSIASYSVDIVTYSVTPGARQAYAVGPLDTLTTWYFAVKSTDATRFTSPLSNGATAVAPVVFLGATPSASNGVAWGDFDGDGDLDLAVSEGASVQFYRNQAGTFSAYTSNAVGGDATYGLAWADFDRDGDLDLLVASYGATSESSVLRNDGASFTRLTLPAGSSTRHRVAAWADYDSDGDPDILLGDGLGGERLLYRNDNGTFVPLGITGSAGSGSGAVAFGDADNDGDLDLAMVVNTDVLVLISSSPGVFASTITISGQTNAQALAWGDYDADGDLDLAVAGMSSGFFRVLRNDGLTFTQTANLTLSDNPSVAWVDIDDDGDLDAVLGSIGPAFSVARNNAGTFVQESWTPPGLGANLASVSVGDFDADNDLDIVAARNNGDGREYIVRNDTVSVNSVPTAPSGGLSAYFDEFSPGASSGTLTLRWNAGGDDKTPAAALEYLVRVGTAGAGSFGLVRVPPRSSVEGHSGSHPYSTRLPGGARGFKVVMSTGGSVNWAVTAVDGGLRRSAESAEQSVSLAAPRAVTDLALVSIVSTGLGASSQTVTLTWTAPGDDGMTGALTGVYDIRWATVPVTTPALYAAANGVRISTSGVTPGARQWASVGPLDPSATWYFVVTATDTMGVRSTLSNATTAPAYALVIPSGGVYHGVAGDYDNDGDLDMMAVQWGATKFLLRNDAGTFTKVSLTGNYSANNMAWADIDNDGDLDSVGANWSANKDIQRNNGNGTFTGSDIVSTGWSSTYIALADIDNDGDTDGLVANASNQSEYLLRNDGTGSFAVSIVTGTSGDSYAAAAGDFDGDGDQDFIVGNQTGQDEYFLINDGRGNFTISTVTSSGGNTVGLSVGDFDGDGDLDVYVCNYNQQQHKILRNDGNWSFTQVAVPNTTSASFNAATAADFDGDGDLDVILSAYPNRILRNDGGLSFTASDVYRAPYTGSYSPGDFDDDRDVDLGGFSVTANSFVRNDAVVRNSTPTPPSSGFGASFAEYSAQSSSGVLTLAWGVGADAETPAVGLEYLVRVGTTGVSGSSTTMRFPSRFATAGNINPMLYSTRIGGGVRGLKLVMQKGTTVHWAVQSMDAGGIRSAASAEQSVLLTAPNPGTNLAVAGDTTLQTSSTAWVRATWTGPGENGATGALGPGAYYDIRWATAAIGSLASYLDAPYASTFSASGGPSAAISRLVSVEPGRAWHFAFTTVNSSGVRSNLSNAASVTPANLVFTATATTAGAYSDLQGNTTGLLKLTLQTSGGTFYLKKLRVAKSGTLDDASISDVGLYIDSDANGVFSAGDTKVSAGTTLFVSSAAVINMSGSGLDVDSVERTYFVAATLASSHLPVDGATMSVRLDGQPFTVSGKAANATAAGVRAPDYTGMFFDGSGQRVSAPVVQLSTFTLEAWGRSTGTLSYGSLVYADPYALVLRNANCSNGAGGLNGPGLPGGGGTILCAASTVDDTSWHHLAAVVGSQVRVYVDGVLEASYAYAPGPITAGSLAMGSNVSAAHLAGEISEVRVSSGARYTSSFIPERRFSADATTLNLYRFDYTDVPENRARDDSGSARHGTRVNAPTGAGYSGAFSATDLGDILRVEAVDVAPAVVSRNDTFVPAMRIKLWTSGDFVTVSSLVVVHTGTAPVSDTTNLRFFLDNGDGVFQSGTDTNVSGSAFFSVDAATLDFTGNGTPQLVNASTKTYFLTFDVTSNAGVGGTVGFSLASTAAFRLAGSTDAVGVGVLPSSTVPRAIQASQNLVTADFSTASWRTFLTFTGVFGSGNVSYYRYVFDRSPGTAVGAGDTQWTTGKATVTAGVDAPDWYFHVRAYDSFSQPGAQSDFGPYRMDATAPTVSAFRVLSSTGGALGPGQAMDLPLGATVQATMQDLTAGINTNALPVRQRIAAWTFQEPGTRALDHSGRGLEAVLSNSGLITGSGYQGSGLLFGGGAVYVTTPTVAPWTGMTAMAWVKPTQDNRSYSTLIASRRGRFQYHSSGGLFRFAMDATATGGCGLATPTAYPLNIWTHVALVYDPANSRNRIYINGAQAAECTGTAALSDTAFTIGIDTISFIGGYDGYVGYIDEVRLFHEALSTAAVQEEMTGSAFDLAYSTNAGATWSVVAATGTTGTRLSHSAALGSVSPEALSVVDLPLAQSTNAVACSNSASCGATNQMRFTVSDQAGNSVLSGYYSVLVDRVLGVTPALTFPASGAKVPYPGVNFNWTGPSSGVVAAFGGGATYVLQVSNNDPSFASTVISISTPAAVNSAAATVDGTYVSTFTLANDTVYYWRVAMRNSLLGTLSPWSSASSFVTDFTRPAGTAYAALSSTGGAIAETRGLDLAGGVTVQMTLQDAGVGLAVSSATDGYGVIYSTTAGQWWVLYSTYSYSSLPAGYAQDLAVFNGKVYAAGSTNLYSSPDGTSWTLARAGAAALLVADGGRLYVANTSTIAYSDDGTTWTTLPAMQGVTVSAMAVYNGTLFAAGLSGGRTRHYSYSGGQWADRTNWSDPAVTMRYAMKAYNGNLYSNAAYYGFNTPAYRWDGSTWTVTSGPLMANGAYSMAEYDGRLCAGNDSGSNPGATVVKCFDGANWTDTSLSSGSQYPNQPKFTLASAGGFLYASMVTGGSTLYAYDGRAWRNSGRPLIAPTGAFYLRGALKGALYGWTSIPGGPIMKIILTSATLSGADGTTAGQTLTAYGLDLVQSTNAATCGGGARCGATNQVVFGARDLAGNATSYSFAVKVDSVVAAAVPVPSFPADGAFVGFQPNFSWGGPSTNIVAGLGPGASYFLEVAANDPTFAAPVISISTPAVVVSTMAPAVDGVYLSTFTLSNNITYYWRVKTRNAVLGDDSPWSATASFVTDFSLPTQQTAFTSVTSTGGAVGETQLNDLTAGVTVQLSVRDTGTGLAVSSSSLPGAGDGHNGQNASSGYGVAYTTNAGSTWVDWSTYTATLTGTGESTIRSMAVFNGKLYAGTSGNGKVYSSTDGVTWSLSLSGTGENTIYSLQVFNGKLYAGTGGGARVYSTSDGTTWNLAHVATGEGYILSMAVHNGKLYAGTYPNATVWATANGTAWTKVRSDSNNRYVYSLASFNGKLYAGTYGPGLLATTDGNTWTTVHGVEAAYNTLAVFNGRLYTGTQGISGAAKVHSSADGTSWTNVFTAPAGSTIWSMAVFNGKLYAGVNNSGRVYATANGTSWYTALSVGGTADFTSLSSFEGRLYAGYGGSGAAYRVTPYPATLTGGNGTVVPQFLSATSLNFVQSTNSLTCGGAVPCGATNQVLVTYSDRAGNVTAKAFAVRVDTVTAVAVSTPFAPTGVVSTAPVFSWSGPSTVTLAGLGAGASYYLEVANDAAFTSLVVSITTPAVVASTVVGAAGGAYASTTTLSAGSYYWRVASYSSVTGLRGPWSSTASFTLDSVRPSSASYSVTSATGGALGEAQWTTLASGVTAQVTVADAATGLAVSTSALAVYGNAKAGGFYGYTGGFGVRYSTNAGQTWTAFSTYTAVSNTGGVGLVIWRGTLYASCASGRVCSSTDGLAWTPGNQAVTNTGVGAMTLFNDMLFSADGSNGIFYSADGANWTLAKNFGPQVVQLVPFQGRLYASVGGSIWASTDGVTNWGMTAPVTTFPGGAVFAMTVFNGRLWAAEYNQSKIFSSFDGVNWTTGVSLPGGALTALAVYDGYLYGANNTAVYRSADGATWTATNQPASCRAGGGPTNLTVSNGQLYSGSYAGAVCATGDGVNWTGPVANLAGSYVNAMASYKGKVYALTQSKLYQMTPLAATLTGADGTTAAQTLTVRDLEFSASTNSTTCAGAQVCGGTNQVAFSASDMAGNIVSAGPYAVIVDTVTSVLVSTPLYPAAGQVLSVQPNFFWRGPSPSAVSALGPFAAFDLQVAADTGFGTPVVSISTTGVVNSTNAATRDGAYVSTFTLAEATTYYWRARSRSTGSGAVGPWSAAESFWLDRTAPVLSSYRVFSATGGVLSESQWQSSTGPAAGAAVQDAGSGLAAAPDAYSALISSDSGASFMAFPSTETSLAAAAVSEQASYAMVPFRSRLYMGTSNEALLRYFDGTAWSSVGGGCTGSGTVYDMAAFGSLLYVAKGVSGTSGAVCTTDGDSPLTDLLAFPGVTGVRALAVHSGSLYLGVDSALMRHVSGGLPERVADLPARIDQLVSFNGRLYAAGSLGAAGAVYVYDAGGGGAGTAYSNGEAVRSLAVHGGRLYAATDSAVVSSADGSSWAAASTLPGSGRKRLVSARGRLWAATANALWVLHSGAWVRVHVDPAMLNDAFAFFGDSAFAGINAGAGDTLEVRRLRMPALTVTGAAGSNAAETLRADLFALANSSRANTCGGAACLAIDRVDIAFGDRAGNSGQAGPFAVLTDTAGPAASVVSFSRTKSYAFISGSGFDYESGLAGYAFQVSTAADFSGTLSSHPYTTVSSGIVSGLSASTTYYLRVAAFDVMGNVGYSAGVSTVTAGTVSASAANAAAATQLQGSASAYLRLDLSVPGGQANATFSSLRVTRLGTGSDGDVAQVELYADQNGNGVFDGGDSQVAQGPFSSGVAALALGGNSRSIGGTAQVFFVALRLSPAAAVGATLGVRVAAPTDIGVSDPNEASGTFPVDSSLTSVVDAANTLLVTPADKAPGSVPPGTANVPAFMLTMQADQGASVLQSLHLRLVGSLPSNMVSAVKVWRDQNANALLDGPDLLMSSGNDAFVSGAATVTLTASQAARTVSTAPARFFVSASLSALANPGDAYRIRIDTAGYLALATTADSVSLSTFPFASSTVTVQTNNVLTAAYASELPSVLVQGGLYAVVRATLTADIGIAQVDRLAVSRTGTGVDADAAAVRVYLDATKDGGTLNTTEDQAIGTGVLSAGALTMQLSTVTVNAGVPEVLFIAVEVDALAAAGNSLGLRLAADAVHPVSGFTTVSASAFNSGISSITAAVNTMHAEVLDQSPGSLLQGATNQAMLRLIVRSDKYAITWNALTVDRLGTAADADAAAIRVYKDADGNGLLQPSVDTLITNGTYTFTAGSAQLGLSPVQTVLAARATYFVAVDVYGDAVPGATFGLRIATTAALAVGAPNLVSTAAFPAQTALVPISQYPNLVAVSTASIAPVGADPGQRDVGLMKLTLNTDVSRATFTSLRVDRSGTLTDAEVSAVKLYADINSLGTFNSQTTGQYLLVTSGADQFGSAGSGAVTLTLASQNGLSPAARTYFVAVDLAAGATPGRTLGVRALNSGYFGVNAPNTVKATSFDSAALSVNTPPSNLYVQSGSSAPASAQQGTSNAVMLRFSAWMDRFTGTLNQVTLTRTGTASDSDITRVRVYRDDGNGTFSAASDTQVSSATFSSGIAALVFSGETMTTSTRTYFVLYDFSPTATAGRTAGASLVTPGSVVLAAPHAASSSGFPHASSTTAIAATVSGISVAGQDRAPATLLQDATSQHMLTLTMNTTQYAALVNGLTLRRLGTAADSDIVRLRVLRDDGDGVFEQNQDALVLDQASPFVTGLAVLSFIPGETVGTSPTRLFVSVDVAQFAQAGKTFGIEISSDSSFSVTAPNYVVPSGFPIQTSAATILKVPDTVVFTPASLITGNLIQGQTASALSLKAYATRDKAVFSSWKLVKQGSLADSGVQSVSLYRDIDADGAVGSSDLLLGSGTFSGGTLTVSLSSAQTVGRSTLSYLAVLAIDQNATVGATLGLVTADASYFGVTAPDSAGAVGLPMQTGLVSILDAKTPTQPVLVFPDGAANGSFERMRFVWTSSVTLGSIQTAEYAIGTTPGGTEVKAWTAMSGTPAEVVVTGLTLLSGTSYYVSARATSSFGFTSPIGMSGAQLADFVVPGTPAPTVTVGASSVLVNWTQTSAGPSGLMGYLVEYRKVDRPVWINAKTGSETGSKVSGFGPAALGVAALTVNDLATPPFLVTLPDGSIILRVTAVGGGGVVGTPSSEIKLQVGPLPAGGIGSASVFPNPFDSRKRSVNISYALSQAAEVTLDIYDIFGREVAHKTFGAGSNGGAQGMNIVTWDGGSDEGGKVSMGVYICVIRSGGAKVVQKIGVVH